MRITISPKTEMYLLLVIGAVGLGLGVLMVDEGHKQAGAIVLLFTTFNLFKAWRIYGREVKKSD